MNPDWQKFLSQQPAHFENEGVQHYGDPATELNASANSTVLCDLSQFGTLRVSGEDAQSFLQNLLSNDIRCVDATHAQLSSFNTAKGRMLAVFLIWRDGEDFCLQLPVSILDMMRKKLSLYVLRAKVKISDASNELICLGVSGKNAESLLRKIYGDVPSAHRGCLTTAGAHILRINDTRFQISSAPSNAPALWNKLVTEAQAVGSRCWEWLDIRAGIPVILPATQEEFVPQMANLDALGGISFKKGCYPGQEIVARMHYLGKLKRRMYLAHIASGDAPQAGDELFSADMEGQCSGMIANAAPAPHGGYDVLAVIQTASVAAAQIKTRDGTILQILPLPYALD